MIAEDNSTEQLIWPKQLSMNTTNVLSYIAWVKVKSSEVKSGEIGTLWLLGILQLHSAADGLFRGSNDHLVSGTPLLFNRCN